MKKLILICSAAAVTFTISACGIFDDDEKPVTRTTTTTEETHTIHSAPSTGVTTETQSVQPAY